jgi:hypothetical protein
MEGIYRVQVVGCHPSANSCCGCCACGEPCKHTVQNRHGSANASSLSCLTTVVCANDYSVPCVKHSAVVDQAASLAEPVMRGHCAPVLSLLCFTTSLPTCWAEAVGSMRDLRTASLGAPRGLSTAKDWGGWVGGGGNGGCQSVHYSSMHDACLRKCGTRMAGASCLGSAAARQTEALCSTPVTNASRSMGSAIA